MEISNEAVLLHVTPRCGIYADSQLSKNGQGTVVKSTGPSAADLAVSVTSVVP